MRTPTKDVDGRDTSLELAGRTLAETAWRSVAGPELEYYRSRTVVIDEIATGRTPVGGLLRAGLLETFPNGTRHNKLRESAVVRAAVIRWNDLVRS